MADEVYRIIPAITKAVNKELLIHKYTGRTTKKWMDEHVKRGNVVRMIFTSNDKRPYMAITPYYMYSECEHNTKGPPKKYVMLKENGEWYSYKPFNIPTWEQRLMNK
jgi:hypothetical protein